MPARLGYYDNYLVDNQSCVIVGVQATAARMSQETVAAQDMLTRFAEWQGRAPESVAADTTYGNGEFLQWLADRNITRICEPATVSTERGVHSLVPSVSLTNRNTIAISALPVSP
jgi:transposase InsO family protein